jgi:hypothetical protein
MAKITIYLPGDLEKKVRKTARAQGRPVSRWIAWQLARIVESGWSREFLRAAGSIPDFPAVEELRRGYGKDSRRTPGIDGPG